MQLPSAIDRTSLASEHAALRLEASLRRIATLVAGGVTAGELFSAVAGEVSVVLDVPVVTVGRYELEGGSPVSVVLASREHIGFPVGSRWPLDGAGTREIFEDGRPIRIEDFAGLEGTLAGAARKQGMNWVVGAPITVDGAVWGNIYAGTTGDEPIQDDAESRLADFTDLVSIAIANSDAREKVGRLLDEQAALRRVATLVAEGATATEVFDAVALEVAEVLGFGTVTVDRYESDGTSIVIAASGPSNAFPVGSRWPLSVTLVGAVHAAGRALRIDDYSQMAEAIGFAAHEVPFVSAAGVPIVVDGALWGAICVGAARVEDMPFDAEVRLAGFTELVATAIANTTARDALRQLADEQAALRRVATLVAEGATATELFAAVAQEVAEVLGIATVTVDRYESDGTSTVMAAWGDSGFPVGSRWPPDRTSVAGTVFATGRSARIDDYSELSGTIASVVQEGPFGSAAGVPIVVDGTLWGAICVGTSRVEDMPADTEARLAGFTELVATAIANTAARDALRRLADEQAALRRVATLVAREASPDEIFGAIAAEAAQLLDTPLVGIDRYESDGSSIVVGAFGDHPFQVGTRSTPDGPSLMRTVFRTGRAARIDDYAGLPGRIAVLARQGGVRSAVGVPILVAGRIWGVMTAGSASAEPLPVDTELRLAGFTELAATSIANAESRAELAASESRARALADEQAALRRVATLVARGASPDELFSAVATEVADVMGIPNVGIRRYEADGTFTVLANAGETPYKVGMRWPVDEGLTGMILATRRPARKDGLTRMQSSSEDAAWEDVWRSTVAVPIVVEGSIWGFMVAADDSPLPADTEKRLARFTELVATAVSNATTRTDLLASRARVVSASDETRRRLERDLHDGIQQWLVALALRARKAAGLSSANESASQELSGLADDLVAVTDELREISRGIHPAILSDAGLDDALAALARRSTIRVDLDVSFRRRYDPALEATVYYVAAESITNAVKHAQASTVTLRGGRRDSAIELEISDDGVGGADPRRGTGLIGLKDRVDSLGGTISFVSPTGAGTTVRVKLPAGPRAAASG